MLQETQGVNYQEFLAPFQGIAQPREILPNRNSAHTMNQKLPRTTKSVNQIFAERKKLACNPSRKWIILLHSEKQKE